MNKESFSHKIDSYTQEFESKKLADIAAEEQRQKEVEEKINLERIKNNKEKEIRQYEIIKKTEENFSGSGIIESFKEIIDKKILIFGYDHDVKRVSLFKKIFSKEQSDIVIPARIDYDINKITLRFDYYSWYSGGDDYDPYSSDNKNITVEKTDDDKFKLTFSLSNRNTYNSIKIKPEFGNGEEITEKIAKFIVSENLDHREFLRENGLL